MIGSTFGKWTVLLRSHATNDVWLCRCSCGHERVIRGKLLRGNTTSQCIRCRNKANRTNHGHSSDGQITRVYRCWQSMVKRCTNPKSTAYKNYGGRGIYVCDRWRSFVLFLKDMGEAPTLLHTIDRINNDQGYSKENCRWSLRSEQSRNKRTNRMLSFNGRTMCLQDWCKELGLSRRALTNRLAKGWPMDDVMNPARKVNQYS